MKKIVLVVEDDLPSAAAYKKALEEWGYEAVIAEDGMAAADLFEDTADGHLSAIISDMRMPRMSGRELCQSLDRSSKKVPPMLVHSSSRYYRIDASDFEIRSLCDWFDFVRETHLKSSDFRYLKKFLQRIK